MLVHKTCSTNSTLHGTVKEIYHPGKVVHFSLIILEKRGLFTGVRSSFSWQIVFMLPHPLYLIMKRL